MLKREISEKLISWKNQEKKKALWKKDCILQGKCDEEWRNRVLSLVSEHVLSAGERTGEIYLWGGSGRIVRSYPHFINNKIELWTASQTGTEFSGFFVEKSRKTPSLFGLFFPHEGLWKNLFIRYWQKIRGGVWCCYKKLTRNYNMEKQINKLI